MRVDREALLQELETVQPGLSPREIVEQSSCFIFKDGKVCTYNDEVACSRECSLSITGAVQAEPLIAILSKLPEQDVDMEEADGELLIKGKRRKAGIRMEADITLPIEAVETPEDWKPLAEDFTEAVSIVNECASRDESKFVLTCIHVHPKFLEATDDVVVTRYRIRTKIAKDFLVRRESLKHITSLGMTEIAETDTWVHFRNPSGLVLSCRRYSEEKGDGEFPDTTPVLAVEGEPITLPSGLGDAVERSQVFSTENPDDDQVLVELHPGRLRIKGQGTSGWFTELKKLKYSGPDLSFYIPPKLLIELTKEHRECQVSQTHLKVDGGKFTYVTCLTLLDEKEAGKLEEEVEE